MSKLRILFIALGALVASAWVALAGPALAADELGRVTAVGGEATAQQPGAAPRALQCGDPVYAGDTLRTGSDSHVGVQLDDVATHVDANSQVEIGRTAQNTPSTRLMAGKVRVIDPRDAGAPPAELAALDTQARVVSNDAEAYIFTEKVGPYAMMCEWSDPLPVTRGKESKTAKPGECVIAKPKEPLYTANAHDQRIPALAQECAPGPELASINDPRHHLSPTDVAAMGPIAAAFVQPAAAPDPKYTCDKAGVCSPVVPLGAVEPVPNVPSDPCRDFGICPQGDGSQPPVNPPKEAGEPPPVNPPKDDGGPPPVTPPPDAGGPPPITPPPIANQGPPPFANTPPAPPVSSVPVFTDTLPGNGGKIPPSFVAPPSFPPNGRGPNA
jgi:hypothetical protein